MITIIEILSQIKTIVKINNGRFLDTDIFKSIVISESLYKYLTENNLAIATTNKSNPTLFGLKVKIAKDLKIGHFQLLKFDINKVK